MRYSHKARSIIIQYIKDSMKPIDCGEVLGGHQITAEGRVRRWFQDILEGNVPLIFGRDSEEYTYVKLHYRWGWSWQRISEEYKIPKTTLYRKRDKFFGDIVENIEPDLAYEILRIDDRHKTESLMGELEPRWESGGPL